MPTSKPVHTTQADETRPATTDDYYIGDGTESEEVTRTAESNTPGPPLSPLVEECPEELEDTESLDRVERGEQTGTVSLCSSPVSIVPQRRDHTPQRSQSPKMSGGDGMAT